MADVTKKVVTQGDGADVPVVARRTSPVEFFNQVVREAKKVTWPTWKETYLTTMMVFIMVGVSMVFFAVVDFFFQYGECLLIGCPTQ